jgi:hypothetical protein
MAHGLHQAYELLLVCHQLEVTCGEGPAEVGEGTVALVKDGTEPAPEASQSMRNGRSKSGI